MHASEDDLCVWERLFGRLCRVDDPTPPPLKLLSENGQIRSLVSGAKIKSLQLERRTVKGHR